VCPRQVGPRNGSPTWSRDKLVRRDQPGSQKGDRVGTGECNPGTGVRTRAKTSLFLSLCSTGAEQSRTRGRLRARATQYWLRTGPERSGASELHRVTAVLRLRCTGPEQSRTGGRLRARAVQRLRGTGPGLPRAGGSSTGSSEACSTPLPLLAVACVLGTAEDDMGVIGYSSAEFRAGIVCRDEYMNDARPWRRQRQERSCPCKAQDRRSPEQVGGAVQKRLSTGKTRCQSGPERASCPK
jgi:hypothetical protein